MKNEGSKLENLKKDLYSKDDKFKEMDNDFDLHSKDYSVKGDWEHKLDNMTKNSRNIGISFWGKFLVFSVIFFLLALAVSAYVFLKGNNVVSSENVEVIVSGPVSVPGGEELSFQVSVLNKNNVALDSANLVIEYPEDTRNSSNLGESLPRYSESLGTIKSGERFQKVLKAVLFGKEGEQKIIKVTVEYRVSGSSAIFYKEKEYDLTISSSPVSLSIESQDEVNSGQEVSFVVKVISNSTTPIKNMMVLADYPFGFKMTSASLKPNLTDNGWYLGDLNPQDKKEITIKGIVEGQDGEDRVFRFSLGIQDDKDDSKIATVFSSALHQISIKKPSLSFNTSVNGKTGNIFVADNGDNVRVDLIWRNNLPTQIADTSAQARLSGNLISKYQIAVPTGYYSSADNSLLWGKDKNNTLSLMNPGDSGTLSFNLRIPPVSDFISAGVSNPSVSIESLIRGIDIISGDTGSGVITNEDKVVIKIASKLALESSATNSIDGKIRVLLKFKNTLNDVSGATVVASLPAYLKWVGNATPAEEELNYNPVGGEISWLLGKVKAGTGYALPSRQISFDVVLEPGYEIGDNPIILKGVKASANDDFTLTPLIYNAPNLEI